jgi:hypothetical protein
VKIDNNIGQLFPGLLPDQGQSRAQTQQQQQQQDTLALVQRSREILPQRGSKEYEEVRRQFETEQTDDRVIRDQANGYVRNALQSYGEIESSADKEYVSDVLGIDYYA